ncbi:MAG: hypothetical protein AVDCRST_MAG66-825, partial [uncultured Pseudonocardia sp.]
AHQHHPGHHHRRHHRIPGASGAARQAEHPDLADDRRRHRGRLHRHVHRAPVRHRRHERHRLARADHPGDRRRHRRRRGGRHLRPARRAPL